VVVVVINYFEDFNRFLKHSVDINLPYITTFHHRKILRSNLNDFNQ
jgi:hypothetical protein